MLRARTTTASVCVGYQPIKSIRIVPMGAVSPRLSPISLRPDCSNPRSGLLRALAAQQASALVSSRIFHPLIPCPHVIPLTARLARRLRELPCSRWRPSAACSGGPLIVPSTASTTPSVRRADGGDGLRGPALDRCSVRPARFGHPSRAIAERDFPPRTRPWFKRRDLRRQPGWSRAGSWRRLPERGALNPGSSSITRSSAGHSRHPKRAT